MATENKDFRVKNGLIVEGTSATVNGENVLTTASNIDSLANVDTTGATSLNVLTYNAENNLWVPANPGGGSGGSSVTISSSSPSSPLVGDLWFNSSNGRMYVYYNDEDSNQWIEIAGAEGPVGPVGPTGPTGPMGTIDSQTEVFAINVKLGSTNTNTSGQVNLDFQQEAFVNQLGLTGNVEYTGSNYLAGRSVTVRVVNGNTEREVSFPESWVFVSDKPSSIDPNKTAILTVTSFGNTENDCVAAWAQEL